LHSLLATASVGIALLVALEAAWRAIREEPPGRLSATLSGLLLAAIGITAAGGLGMLAGGARPRESLHFVYALLALGAVPLASSLTSEASPRLQGVVTALAAAVSLAVVARLFGTG
jgi:hypothetical protein